MIAYIERPGPPEGRTDQTGIEIDWKKVARNTIIVFIWILLMWIAFWSSEAMCSDPNWKTEMITYPIWYAFFIGFSAALNWFVVFVFKSNNSNDNKFPGYVNAPPPPLRLKFPYDVIPKYLQAANVCADLQIEKNTLNRVIEIINQYLKEEKND